MFDNNFCVHFYNTLFCDNTSVITASDRECVVITLYIGVDGIGLSTHK